MPQGFEKYYPENVILLLIQTLYGCKQSAYKYWQVLVKAWRAMKNKRSKSEPCLYFKQENNELSFGISWVDDLMMVAMNKQKTMGMGEQMREHFTLDNGCELSEHVGCKIEWNKNERSMKLTQPVLLQSYVDEFELPDANFTTPAVAGKVLCIDEKDMPANKGKNIYTKQG